MKLLTKTTIYYLLSTLGIFILGGLVFYFILAGIINHEVDEKLAFQKDRVIERLSTIPRVPGDTTLSLNPQVRVSRLNHLPTAEMIIRDTLVFDSLENEFMPHRQLFYVTKLHNQPYQIRVSEPMVESESLIQGIVYSEILLFLTLFVVLLFLNYKIDNKLWSPFYKTVNKLKTYDVTRHQSLKMEKVPIKEFDELNRILSGMTGKIARDYQNLKQFTENASHEIQTPLAIIQSKMELLLQSENLTQEQLRQVQSAYQSANRLSKLNQALILLAKIENQEFVGTEPVHLRRLLEKQLASHQELLDLRGLRVQTIFSADPVIEIAPELADLLIRNLLGNAIKHNQDGGVIIINLSEYNFHIVNTGAPIKEEPSRIFERFYTQDAGKDSLGLGLAIVRKICEVSNLQIDYNYENDLHVFTLSF